MSKYLIRFSLSRPLWIYGLLLLVTLLTAGLIVNIQVDTDPENMLPADEPARVYHNKVKKDFLLNDLIVVGVVSAKSDSIFNQQSLTDLKTLTDSINGIEGVNHSDTNAITTIDNIEQAEPGTIRFEWMMPDAPQSQSEALSIAEKTQRLPFVVNSLVSGDQKAATIYVPIFDKNESYRIANEIKQAIAQLSDANDYHITGLPVAEDTFGFEMFVQMGISAPTAALVIFCIMLYFFRSVALVTAPMIVAMSTVIIIMGTMIGMGYTVHIMSSMIAIFLMPIAVVDSVHLMSEFVDVYRPGKAAKESISQVTQKLFKPMLFTSITSAAGFFSLALTPIPPVQIFGLFVGSGILLAFFITIIFIPAYISRMNDSTLKLMQDKLYEGEKTRSFIARVLPSWGRFSIAHNKLIILFSVGVVVFSIVGLFRIEINDNPVRWFKSDHPVRIADKVLNQHFAGTYDAHLVFEFSATKSLVDTWKAKLINNDSMDQLSANSRSKIISFIEENVTDNPYQDFILLVDELIFEETDRGVEVLETFISLSEEFSMHSRYFTQPKNLAYIERLQQYLLSSGQVGKSNSVVDLIKTVNRELRSGNDTDYVIPHSQNAVSQTLLQYQSSHRPQDLWHFITPDYSKTLVWLQMTSGDNKNMAEVIKLVDEFVAENPLPEEVSMNWAGKTYLNLVWQNQMVAGMFDSLTSAFVIVFVMMVLLFRSLIFGLLAMLPLSITILLMYGMIGWVGKYYDMPIAVLSALTLGLSVDFSIHFIERLRTIFKQTGEWKKTIELMFNEPARAITRNALVIAFGFTPLLLAPLIPYITVGVFLASIMAISALVTLLVLPACIQILQSFILKKA